MRKLLADESVDFRIVRALRQQQYVVDAIVEISPGISDDAVVEVATKLESILLTQDKDFGELTYRLKKSGYGVILLRFNINEAIEQRIALTKKVLEEHGEQLEYKFTVVTSKKIRIKEM